MASTRLASLSLLIVGLAAAGSLLAQTPSDASNTPAATTTAQAPAAAPATPAAAPADSPAPAAGPSADTIKKARMAGYHPETKNGKTLFCQETANMGTRFPTKKCLNEQQIASVLDIQNQNKDSLNKPFMCAGAGCTQH